MVPPYVLVIPELPLTPNGKVDLNALATPELGLHSAECVAPRDSVERQLQSVWEQALQRVGIGVRDKFFAVGGHSLLALRVLAQVEKVFGTRLSVTTFFQNPTIEQLARLLRAPQAAGMEKDLVEIQVGGSKPPLVLVHGVGGGMLWGYGNLAKRLGTDQPVLAFKSRGLEGRDEHQTIEAMAADYVHQLRAGLPHGPYYLGGYCFGGVVAYEMARQLQAQGETIALLALINSSPPNSSYAKVSVTPSYAWKFIANFCHWSANSLNWTPEQRRGFFQWKVRLLKRRLQRLVRGGQPVRIEIDELIDLAQYPEDQRRVWEAHIRALVHYHPKPYAGHVTLFRSPVHHLVCSFDPAYGWAEFAQGGVTVRIVAGAHEKVIEEPHVETLAAEITAALENAQKWATGSPGHPLNGKNHDHVDRLISESAKAAPVTLGAQQ
jgi:thioesterase domain-containing protein